MTTQGLLLRALADALSASQIPNGDMAAVALARQYASLLDQARDTEAELVTLDRLGPKLLATLTALGMTATGRGVKGGAGNASPVASALDEFTARRTRKHAS